MAIQEQMNKENEPTLENFFKYCRKFYGYDIHYAELLFSEYTINGTKVKSQKKLFCKLSDMYFREKHNVPNPVKDGKWGVKTWLAVKYNDKYKPHMSLNDVMKSDEYSAFFEKFWAELISDVEVDL